MIAHVRKNRPVLARLTHCPVVFPNSPSPKQSTKGTSRNNLSNICDSTGVSWCNLYDDRGSLYANINPIECFFNFTLSLNDFNLASTNSSVAFLLQNCEPRIEPVIRIGTTYGLFISHGMSLVIYYCTNVIHICLVIHHSRNYFIPFAKYMQKE